MQSRIYPKVRMTLKNPTTKKKKQRPKRKSKNGLTKKISWKKKSKLEKKTRFPSLQTGNKAGYMASYENPLFSPVRSIRSRDPESESRC